MQRVEISNFRSVKNAALAFEPRCRILIGKNEVGKTNILSACGLLDPNASVVPGDLRETKDGEDPVTEGYVRFVFALSSAEVGRFQKCISERVLGLKVPLLLWQGKQLLPEEFVKQFREYLYIVALPSGKRRHTYWSKGQLQLEKGWLIPKQNVAESVQVKHGERTIAAATILFAHESSVSDEDKQHFDDASSSTLIDRYWKGLRESVQPEIPKCLSWKYSDTALLPASIDLESFKTNPATCEPLRAMFTLAGEADPAVAIGRALGRPNGLKNLLTRVARTTTSHVKERWPEIGNIDIVLSPNGAQIDAAVRDAYNEYSFSRRSDGFKRFVLFLILVSARSVASELSEVLFIQDEPDLGLHPTGVKCLHEELISLSASNYVLISSHSIFMVDRERIDRHLIVTKQDEVTAISDVTASNIKDEEVLYNALGYSLFDLVRPVNLVFEGWRDKVLFAAQIRRRGEAEKFLREKMRTELGIVHAMGVKDIPKVLTYLEAIGRRSSVISDGDPVARQKQLLLRAEKPDVEWKRYDELTGQDRHLTAEDFIKPVALRNALLQVLAESGTQAQPPVDLCERPNQGGVIARIEQWLQDSEWPDPGARKNLLNKWKSRIFDNLKVEEVDDSYSEVVRGIARMMGFSVDAAADVEAE